MMMQPPARASAAVVLLLACAGCGTDGGSACGPSKAQVTRVLDGDTVELADGTKIRYLLINTPEIAHNASETSQCFGDEARVYDEQLVLGRDVNLEYDKECKDRYGRTLAYVSVEGRSINELLIERGYARLEVIAPNDRYAERYRTLEAQAKASGAGLWGACQ
jgi:micrococcal nuclease